MNWHFCIDSAEKRVLDFCEGSLTEGDGWGCGGAAGLAERLGGGYGYFNGDGPGGGGVDAKAAGNGKGDGGSSNKW